MLIFIYSIKKNESMFTQANYSQYSALLYFIDLLPVLEYCAVVSNAECLEFSKAFYWKT